MNERTAVYGWIARHGLDARRARQLMELAGFGREPEGLARRWWTAVAVLAAALGGLGVMLWIAANWDTLGRTGRFALLQAVLAVMCAGAALQPRARLPLALVAMLCIGALFAYFGQTYQTGADPWQLFALWALLALPLCLAMRSDVLWAPWALVASIAISLWTHAHTGYRWRVEPQELHLFFTAWGASLLLVLALGPAGAEVTGAGPWGLRTAATCTVLLLTFAGLGALFASDVPPQYPFAIAVLVAAGAAVAFAGWFDVFVLSAIALGLDALLVAGFGRFLFRSGMRGNEVGSFLLLGLAAAAILAATVSFITRTAKHHG